MELVYLWVEDYKNIKKQGFNFSPRFKCEYDEEKNELTIDENKDYVSIFPENINISAIVGENGAGKSSIFEILLSEYKKQEKDILVIVNTVEGLKYISNNIKLKNFSQDNDKLIKRIIYFSNTLSSITNKENIPETIQNHIPKRFEQDLAKLYKELFKDDYFSIYETEVGLFTLNLQEVLAKNPNTFMKLDSRVSFTKFKYQLDFSILMKNIKNNNFYHKSIIRSKNDPTSQLLKFILISRWKSSFFYNKDVDLILKKNRKIFTNELFSIKDYKLINSQLNELSEIKEYSYDNIERFISIFDYKKNEMWVSNNFYSIENKDVNPLLNCWRFFFYSRINFYKDSNEELDYLSLSSGEREYIKLLTTYIYTLIKNNNNKIYFLDEVDLSLHPNWQKRIIYDLIQFTKMFNDKNKIQLIFSTHSPFILSDLSKENVMFLEKGKQIDIGIKPFGANIHTLLSHGFFMKDGLMGEFAKNKISKILKFLKEENSFIDLEVKFLPPLKIQANFFEKYLKPIIEFIGEDFLKEKLLKMYEIKFPKSNEAKIRELEDEIKRLKNATN